VVDVCGCVTAVSLCSSSPVLDVVSSQPSTTAAANTLTTPSIPHSHSSSQPSAATTAARSMPSKLVTSTTDAAAYDELVEAAGDMTTLPAVSRRLILSVSTKDLC